MTEQPPSPDKERQFAASDIVRALYQSLLGRKPDQSGFELHVKSLQTASLDYVLEIFANSAELRNRYATAPGNLDLNLGPAMSVQTRLSPDETNQLWAHVRRVWNDLGLTEPYWSVLTNPKFRADEIHQADLLEKFYASGVDDVRYLDAFLQRNGLALPPDALVAEFGCGVGRVTGAMARRFAKVLAFDVSASHLSAARERMAREDVTNVEFVLLEQPDDLERLKNIDLFFSMIVLQHNPPPIMAEILTRACGGLNDGGIAFFQAPTYGKDYAFNIDHYLAGDYQKREMEMHFLPQSQIFAILQAAKLSPIEIRQDHCVGHYDRWISNTFLARKQGP